MTTEKPKTTHYGRKRREGINPSGFQMPANPWWAKNKAGPGLAGAAGNSPSWRPDSGECGLSALAISDTGIRTDAEGRYCLNDLHRASGAEARHRPNYWLENSQTQALVAELAKAGIPAIEAKQGLGTYVARDLVYAYAMWISPAFYLKVIRAYDAMVQQGVTVSQEVVKTIEGMQARIAALESSAAERAAIDCEYAPIFAMRRKYSEYIRWQPLAEATDALGLDTKKVPHNPYGLVNSYHRLAWLEAYGIEI